MPIRKIIFVGLVLASYASSLPLSPSTKDTSTDWYQDSATGIAKSLSSREEDTDWYADSASGVPQSLERRDDAMDWYTDSAAGLAGSLAAREDTDWYADSASGIAHEVNKRGEDTDWYADSASGIATNIDKRGEDTDWYADSASGISNEINKRDEDTDWYTDSASGVADSLEKRGEDTDWYTDSASGVAKELDKRDAKYDEKEAYELKLRRWIYNNMRGESLRETSERGKALFQFTVKPRDDVVDRWHVPADLESRYAHSDSDADRVSVLNYYLMVTGREPKSAAELGFTPTASEPGLVEANEVGFGYALAGQHQYHCVDFVADAIDIGKENINDFYLKHTIHCLGLLKYLAPNLTMRQPLAMLRAPANERVKTGYKQTID